MNKPLCMAFWYAWCGVAYSIRTQRNMKIHLLAAAVVLGAALYFDIGGLEIAVLLLTIAGVITAELFNTAIEALVDMVSPEYHPLAKAAKDVAAGAVLVQAAAAIGIGYVIFADKLFK